MFTSTTTTCLAPSHHPSRGTQIVGSGHCLARRITPFVGNFPKSAGKPKQGSPKPLRQPNPRLLRDDAQLAKHLQRLAPSTAVGCRAVGVGPGAAAQGQATTLQGTLQVIHLRRCEACQEDVRILVGIQANRMEIDGWMDGWISYRLDVELMGWKISWRMDLCKKLVCVFCLNSSAS